MHHGIGHMVYTPAYVVKNVWEEKRKGGLVVMIVIIVVWNK